MKTVRQLVKELQALDDTLPVVGWHVRGGATDIGNPTPVRIVVDGGGSYMGQHALLDEDEIKQIGPDGMFRGEQTTPAIQL